MEPPRHPKRNRRTTQLHAVLPARLSGSARVPKVLPCSEGATLSQSANASPVPKFLRDGSQLHIVESRFLDSTEGLADEAQLVDRLFGDEIAELFNAARR
jgi:hypothetical protein